MDQMSRLIVLSIETSGVAKPPGWGGDGYPPFDVERFANSDGSALLRITLAVAGFEVDDLEILATPDQLVIQGRQTNEPDRSYLYRGIAARRFRKGFALADGLKVVAANLKNGLLAIDLAQPPQDCNSRAIAIDVAG